MRKAGGARAPPASSQTNSERGGAAAGALDLGLGRARERVDGHVDLDADLAGAEHLDRLALADRTLGDQVRDGDGATLGEQLAELVQVHDLELDLERVLEALELRE